MSSSQIVPISALETELIDAAFCGKWAGPPELPISLSASQQADITVEGAFLQKLLLGLISPPATAGHNPRIYGIRLQGAIIKGEIDLSDCTGMKGTPLPPLLLKRCIIRGRLSKEKSVVCNGAKEEKILSAINASNARLKRLSLRECRIDGRVDLTDATLDGDLDISDVESLSSDCYCQISLRRCRIDGSVIAQRTRLRIPSDQCTEFGLPDYALNLVSAEVYGSVWLQPDFYARGGVSVRGAHITGNIWARGAEFIAASSKIAFRAESLQCDGAVALCASNKTGKQCKAEGDLNFEGARIGYLDLRGIHIDGSPLVAAQKNLQERAANQESMEQPPVDQDFALNLNLAHVRDNFRLRNFFMKSGTIVETIIKGQIDARGMTVGGDFDLTGLRLHLPAGWEYSGIIASNARVGGDLTLNDFTSSINLSSSHVERNLNVTNSVMAAPRNSKYGFQAYNVTVGNDFNLEAVSGSVDVELSRIGGVLTIHAKNLEDLNAKEAEVRGSVTISGIFKPKEKGQSVCFDGGKYLSGFCIGDCKSTCTENQSLTLTQFDLETQSEQGATNQNYTCNPALSIESAFIENNFRVSRVVVESKNTEPITVSLRGLKARVFEHSPSRSWNGDIKLKLAGFEYDRIEGLPNEGNVIAEASNKTSKVKFEKSSCASLEKNLKKIFPLRTSSNKEPVDAHHEEPVDAHQDWLSLQKDYGTAAGYEPQPYEQLARALRNDGKFEDAKHITLQKLSLERQTMNWGLTRGFFSIMERFFDYGLFPCSSIGWFLVLWMLGTIGFCIANSESDPVLVLHAPAVSTFALSDEVKADGPPMGMKKTLKFDDFSKHDEAKYDEVVFERLCGDEIESWWYALDVFVPLLDLKQEDKCSITMRNSGLNWLWRALSNLYEILGAIVTPIMLLSVSGLLRRYVEK